uniref:ADP-ribosylation factor-like protein 15 n=1 Tax=Oncorhynchus tshawytscha TaxID=74940 RepID=A0AAZ3SPJ8_ONCTS
MCKRLAGSGSILCCATGLLLTWKCADDRLPTLFTLSSLLPAWPHSVTSLPAWLVVLSGVTLLPGTMSEHMQLSFALCRIGFYTCFRALCCKGPPPSRPEYDVVCIGLTGAGKSSLLAWLCNEGSHGIGPTTGAENIKKYWSRYYQGSQGVVFVLDSASSDEELESARNELHSALQHPQLCTLPFLILANHQDKPAARPPNQIKKYFELEPLARGKRWILEGSTTNNMVAVKENFIQLIRLLEDTDTGLPARI